jgi:hypothetical protein
MSKMSNEDIRVQNEAIEMQLTDGDGNEIIGMIRVIKVKEPNAEEGAPRSFHLELDMDDALWNQIVFYGSEIFNNVDLLHAGIRGAILERLARTKGM